MFNESVTSTVDISFGINSVRSEDEMQDEMEQCFSSTDVFELTKTGTNGRVSEYELTVFDVVDFEKHGEDGSEITYKDTMDKDTAYKTQFEWMLNVIHVETDARPANVITEQAP